MPTTLWPPPLDDREVWTGEWPGHRECREFGWYGRVVSGKWVPCGPQDPGAIEDLNRLHSEAEWDRDRKRFVRTTLTEAFGEMNRRGILVSAGHELSRANAIDWLSKAAVSKVERREPVQGYAFYTFLGKWKKLRDKDFAVHFGQIVDPHRGPIGLPAEEVGEAVCDCLAENGVKHSWKGDAGRPIRIFTESIVTLPVATDEYVGDGACKECR